MGIYYLLVLWGWGLCQNCICSKLMEYFGKDKCTDCDMKQGCIGPLERAESLVKLFWCCPATLISE